MGVAWGVSGRHLLKRVDLVGPWEFHCCSSQKEYDERQGPLICYWYCSRASYILIQELNKHLLWQTKHSERTAYVLSRLSWGTAHAGSTFIWGEASLLPHARTRASVTHWRSWVLPWRGSRCRPHGCLPPLHRRAKQGLQDISIRNPKGFILKLPLPPHHQMLSYPLPSHSSDLSQLL